MAKQIVVKASEISQHERKTVDADGISVAVFRIGSKYYALENTCPHQGGPLGDGDFVDGATVACPWHGWTFDVRTGLNTKFPDTIKIKTFPVKVEGEDIKITIE